MTTTTAKTTQHSKLEQDIEKAMTFKGSDRQVEILSLLSALSSRRRSSVVWTIQPASNAG